MLQGEHSEILPTFIKQPFVIMIFVLSILNSRFTQVLLYMMKNGENMNEKRMVYTVTCSLLYILNFATMLWNAGHLLYIIQIQ